jgi:hypothetical protein
MGTNRALSLSIFSYTPVRQNLYNNWSKTKQIQKLIQLNSFYDFLLDFGTVTTVVILFFILVEG